MKTKLIGLGIIIFLGITLYWFINSNIKLRNDNERLNYNIENIGFKLDSTVNKNGELQYSVNSLTIKDKELSTYNSELEQSLKDMGLKIKNLQNVSNIEYKYVYLTDTLNVSKINDTVYIAKTNDEYIDLSQRITLIQNGNNILVDSLQLILKDSLILASEIKWKGCWFWKKPVSMKLHIKSANPYFQLNKVETFEFIKNNGKSKRK